MYSTTQVAESVKTTPRTIRIWEVSGIFGKVSRNIRGDREFTQEQLDFARVATVCTLLGKSLPEISDIRSKWESELVREKFRIEATLLSTFIYDTNLAVYQKEWDL